MSELGNPTSLYLGRVVGLGATKDGNSFVVYAVSGRSEGSRERKLIIKDDGSVWTDCLGEPTPEQLEKSDILFYPAIKTGFSEITGNYAVVSNGVHTNKIEENFREKCLARPAVKEALREFGPEPDFYKTPRIAGLSLPDYEMESDVIGIVTEHIAKNPRCVYVETENGFAKWISTYTGGFNENEKAYDVIIPNYFDFRETRKKMEGRSPQELVDELYEWMNPKLVVSTAAAVLDRKNDGWDMAVKNLHD